MTEKKVDQNKRSTVKTIAAGVGGLVVGGAVGALGFPRTVPETVAEKTWLPATWDKEADVVVVGSGGGGCAAAITAADAGAKVILLEVAPYIGGESHLCVGSLTPCIGSKNFPTDPHDSTDVYLADMQKMSPDNYTRADPDILKFQADHGGETMDWLAGLSVQLRGPMYYPGHTYPRTVILVPNSSVWPSVLQPIMEQKGVQILLQTRAISLYHDPSNRILGVSAVDQTSNTSMTIKANRAVVLAAESIAASQTLKERVTTKELAAGAAFAAHKYNVGDGLLMAADVGGQITNFDSYGSAGLRSAGPGPDSASTGKQAWMPYGIIDAGAILVNKNAQRFVDETSGGTNQTLATMQQPDATCFMIFDDLVAQLFNSWDPRYDDPFAAAAANYLPMVISSIGGGGPQPNNLNPKWMWGLVDDFIATKGITKADTIEGLASAVGLDPTALRATIDKWNSYCTAKKDDDFNRKTFGTPKVPETGAGITKGPFYCHSPIRPEVTSGHWSLIINTKMQVLDESGKAIPGLYAVGNNGCGVLGAAGHGGQMCWTFTSGRYAGTNAAAETPWT
jgi:succinate dehydrogenase/fumarate reductase flavoprotein subunit